MQTLDQNTVAQPTGSRGIVLAETHSVEPSMEAAMARRRFQDPEPFRERNWWFILVWQDEFTDGKRHRKRKRITLAPATMPEREVKKIAAEYLRPMNQGLTLTNSAASFGSFVDQIYIPIVLPLLAKSTQGRYEGVIRNYLKPQFGNLCLRDVTSLTVQRYFSGMAHSPLSGESRDKIRDVLASILTAAVQHNFLVRNPVEGLLLPPARKGKSTKPYITPAQLANLVALMQEPYATMVFVAVYTGLRVSELIGLRWEDIHEDSITIDEVFCRGDWGAPKSDASNTTIAVNSEVINRIHRLRGLTVTVRAGTAIRKCRVAKSCGPADLVFQSLYTGAPMRDNNILTRHIKPAARRLGLDFVNWRCLRTSHATWLKMAGADVKDAQAQMRHSKASTTLDIYQQFVPESQRRVVDRLSDLGRSEMIQ